MPEATTHRPAGRGPALSGFTAPLAVLVGGFLGAGARAIVGVTFPAGPGGFPVSTLTVNLVGSLFLGLYLARRERAVEGRWSVPFWAIGVLGSFTTFSAFGLDVVVLLEVGRPGMAATYVLGSVLGGLAAAGFGVRVGSVAR